MGYSIVVSSREIARAGGDACAREGRGHGSTNSRRGVVIVHGHNKMSWRRRGWAKRSTMLALTMYVVH